MFLNITHKMESYFLDAKMKKNCALDCKVLDLKALQVETIFKLPRDNYSFINPIFYNGYAYWQDTLRSLIL